jgi:hypothetical protein
MLLLICYSYILSYDSRISIVDSEMDDWIRSILPKIVSLDSTGKRLMRV